MFLNYGVGEDSWVPWTVRRSKQSILKEITPEYSLEGLMLKLKLPNTWCWLIGKDPDAGKDWRQEKRMTEDEMVRWHHWLNRHELKQAPEMVKDREACHASVYGVAKSLTWLKHWTTTMFHLSFDAFTVKKAQRCNFSLSQIQGEWHGTEPKWTLSGRVAHSYQWNMDRNEINPFQAETRLPLFSLFTIPSRNDKEAVYWVVITILYQSVSSIYLTFKSEA